MEVIKNRKHLIKQPNTNSIRFNFWFQHFTRSAMPWFQKVTRPKKLLSPKFEKQKSNYVHLELVYLVGNFKLNIIFPAALFLEQL